MGAVKLCEWEELAENEAREMTAPDGEIILLVRDGDRCYAVEADCPHKGAPLAEAEIGDGKITCALHCWCWRLEDGAPVSPEEAADTPLRTWPVEVRDGAVWLLKDGE